MNDNELFQHWHLNGIERCPDLTVSGSPNRSVDRFVFRDGQGILHIAEGFAPAKKNKQITQNILLEFLQKNSLPVRPYLRTADDAHGVDADSCFYQVRPWVDADLLPRETLGDAVDFAALWAEFLLEFKRVSLLDGLPVAPNPRFYFGDKLPSLERFLRQQMPALRSDYCQVLRKLEPFLNSERELPVMLAHGDFHPGNVLIKNGAVAAVIDWEFAGKKAAGYDLALLIGCLGFDRADWLYGDAVAELRSRLMLSDYLPQSAWLYLPELIAAIRLGWLGEWIDLKEEELAAQELAFVSDLLDTFRDAWRASC